MIVDIIITIINVILLGFHLYIYFETKKLEVWEPEEEVEKKEILEMDFDNDSKLTIGQLIEISMEYTGKPRNTYMSKNWNKIIKETLDWMSEQWYLSDPHWYLKRIFSWCDSDEINDYLLQNYTYPNNS